MEKIKKLKDIIDQSKTIVFFGGAGVSTESNIPDFRSQNGIYNSKYEYPPETILSHRFFNEHVDDFYKFYRDKMIYLDAKPNDAHYALAKLESRGKLLAIITQNIDNLHQMAGSKNVLELHGTVNKNHCLDCGKMFDLDYIIKTNNIPYCDECSGIIKPNVVLYEESLDNEVLNESIKAISSADTLIIGGTSLAVYPAARLIRYFTGVNLIIINKDKTQYDEYAELVIHDNIGKVLKSVI